MTKIEINNAVQLIFDDVCHPYLTKASFVEMFEKLQKKVKNFIKQLNQNQIEQLNIQVSQSKIKHSENDLTEAIFERFFMIELIRKIIDEYFFTISNMPGFKNFFWEYLEINGYSHEDIFYK